MNSNAEFRNDGLLTIWRDLTTEPIWKYEELPPVLLSHVRNLNWRGADDSELSRAIWFWCRQPKLMFHDSATPIILALCVFISLCMVLVNWPGTSISQRVAELTIVFLEVSVEIYAIGSRLKFLRWRREYERSIDRLIMTHHPEV